MRFTAMASCCAIILGCSQPNSEGQEPSASATSDGFPRNCSNCHGSDESPAPPVDLLGQTDPALRGVGAHRAHLVATHGLSKPVPCGSCHTVPAASDSPGHMDGPWPAEVVFGGLAVAGGAQPILAADKGTGDARKDAQLPVTCASVYCHGATLSGGTATSPVWNSATGTNYVRCDACHGFPPALKRNQEPHPASSACGSCHSQTVSAADNTAIAHPENHINGRVDLTGSSSGCNGCHGDPGAQDTAPGEPSTAPPVDTKGNQATTAIGVGAHQSHLRPDQSAPVACSACHVVPSAVDSPGHNVGSTAPVTFGALAGARGATPTWDRSRATCSTYCHGQTLAGGSNTSPRWTQVDGTQAACGTCHGIPPPAPHVQSSACSSCHDTVGADNLTIAKPAQHVDGTVNVAGGNSCHSCHGSATSNAPPKDAHGNIATSSIGVGAHQKHLGTTSAKALGCADCHVVPTSTAHSSGVAEVAFGARSKTGGLSPTWSEAAATCASTWCHGPTNGGGSNHSPVWTRVGAGQAACGTCHGIPPPAPHVQSSACSSCHDTVGADNLTIAKPAQHVDGTVNTTGGGNSCHSCHGSATSNAPPKDAHGNTATSSVGVGAHQKHLQAATLSNPIACDQCHSVPSSMSHSNGVAELTWGSLAKANGLSPSFNATSATCTNVWCHAPVGYGLIFPGTAGGFNHTPTWTRVGELQATCGTCHGVPPPTGQHGKHARTGCDACHSGYSVASVNKANHVNGRVDIGGSRLSAGNYRNGSCTPSCHGRKSWIGGDDD